MLDAEDPRALAEFYRRLLGLAYRPGDEASAEGPDDADWLVLVDADGRRVLAFQGVDRLEPSTWPRHDIPQQLHPDTVVGSRDELATVMGLALSLDAEHLLDRSDDPDEPLHVLQDPAGHPFCVVVSDAVGA
ncbi:VOC family protein [Brachybacterium huguangmaarense]